MLSATSRQAKSAPPRSPREIATSQRTCCLRVVFDSRGCIRELEEDEANGLQGVQARPSAGNGRVRHLYGYAAEEAPMGDQGRQMSRFQITLVRPEGFLHTEAFQWGFVGVCIRELS
jgi:hypothetical protein